MMTNKIEKDGFAGVTSLYLAFLILQTVQMLPEHRITHENIEEFLRDKFAYDDSENQKYEVVEGAISGNDLLSHDVRFDHLTLLRVREFGTTVKRDDNTYFRVGEIRYQRLS